MRKIAVIFSAVLFCITLAIPAYAGTRGGVNNYNTTVCGHKYVPVDMGHGDYFNVYNEPSGNSCVTVNKRYLNFYVTTKTATALWGYPNISSGIEWGKYTCYDGKSAYPGNGSTCMRYPVQEKYDGTPVTSIEHVWPHLINGNVSYDMWFNKTYVKPENLRQNDGAEVMIWLQHPGVPLSHYHILWYANINGHEYAVTGWTAGHNGKTWYYTAYIALHTMSSFPKQKLNSFFSDVITHGRLSPNWWLTSINFGTEINQGGNGFAVRNYSLTGVN
jgi:hypothetical protein